MEKLNWKTMVYLFIEYVIYIKNSLKFCFEHFSSLRLLFARYCNLFILSHVRSFWLVVFIIYERFLAPLLSSFANETLEFLSFPFSLCHLQNVDLAVRLEKKSKFFLFLTVFDSFAS